MKTIRPTYSISIPEPCHEDWNKMTPTEKGRHCASCQKEVIDFTNKNNEQLFKLIDKGSNMCGRFRKEQLDTPLQLNRKEKNNLASLAASAALPIALLLSNETAAQDNSPKTEQVVQTSKTYTSLGIGMQHRELKEKTEFLITGTVTDDTGLPLPGVNVLIEGTTIGTQTDFDGNYAITAEKNRILVFAYVGYMTDKVIVKGNASEINITLSVSETMSLGIVVIARRAIEPSPISNTHIFGGNYDKNNNAQELRELSKRNRKVAYTQKKLNKKTGN